MKNKINAGVVLVTKFVRAHNKIFKEYINYIDRDEATRNNNFEKYYLDQLTDEVKKENYLMYMDNPNKTTGLFTENLDVLDEEQKDSLKNLFQMAQDNNSNMWQTVISFDNRWLEDNGLYNPNTRNLNENKMREITREAMNSLIGSEQLENSVWSASIHYNTDNIHIHIATVQPFPDREVITEGVYAGEQRGMWKKKSLKKAKSAVVNNIINTKELNQEVNKIVRNTFIEQLKKEKLQTSSNFIKLYNDIKAALPENKRYWKYGYKKIDIARPLIDKFTDEFLNTYFKEDYEELLKQCKTLEDKYKIAYGGETNDFTSNHIKDLYSRMGNTILNNLKDLDYSDVDIASNYEFLTENIDSKDNIENDCENCESEKNIISDLDLPLYTDNNSEFSDIIKDLRIEWRKDKFSLFKKMLYSDDETKKVDAIKNLKILSTSGNMLAAYELAKAYRSGNGVDIDINTSDEYYKIAFEGFNILITTENDPRKKSFINYRLGNSYQYGLGTGINKEKAWECYSQEHTGLCLYAKANMILNNEHDASIEEAETYLNTILNSPNDIMLPFAAYKLANLAQKDIIDKTKYNIYHLYKTALEGFISSNNKSDVIQYRIGMMYKLGQGTEVNEEEAIKYFKIAAKNGNALAQYEYANYLIKNNLNIEKAIKLLTQAATKGNNAFAQYKLGKYYSEFNTQHCDEKLAEKYFKMAAEQDNAFAQYELSKLYIAKFDKTGNKNILKTGIDYLTEASKTNNLAQYKLGYYYLKGKYVVLNTEKAETYLTASANQGNRFAMYSLGCLLLNKETKDEQIKGAKWIKLAAQEIDTARYKLAMLYIKGDIIDKNTSKGIELLEELAKDNNTFAMYSLGVIYYKGVEDIKSNKSKGLEYLNKAAKLGNNLAKNYLEEIRKYNSISTPQKRRRYNNFKQITTVKYSLNNLLNSLKNDYSDRKQHILNQIEFQKISKHQEQDL